MAYRHSIMNESFKVRKTFREGFHCADGRRMDVELFQFQPIRIVSLDTERNFQQLVHHLRRYFCLDFGSEIEFVADLEDRFQDIRWTGVDYFTSSKFFYIPKSHLSSHERSNPHRAGEHLAGVASIGLK